MDKKIIIYAILLSFLTNCSIIQKSKSKEKEKIEISEIQKKDIELKSETSLETNSLISENNQLISLLSSLNWQYAGKDSAEIEIIQTPTGIKIKTKGTATADLKVNSESETNKKEVHSESKTDLKISSSEKSQEESVKKSATKFKSETVTKKKVDISPWFYIIGGILLIITLVLYWFFGKPKKSHPK